MEPAGMNPPPGDGIMSTTHRMCPQQLLYLLVGVSPNLEPIPDVLSNGNVIEYGGGHQTDL